MQFEKIRWPGKSEIFLHLDYVAKGREVKLSILVESIGSIYANQLLVFSQRVRGIVVGVILWNILLDLSSRSVEELLLANTLLSNTAEVCARDFPDGYILVKCDCLLVEKAIVLILEDRRSLSI